MIPNILNNSAWLGCDSELLPVKKRNLEKIFIENAGCIYPKRGNLKLDI